MLQNGMDYTSTVFGEKGRSKKGREHLRSRADIIRDLSANANIHNGDAFTVVCWQAMNLVRDITKAKTHFFAVTLLRNHASTNPRAMYSLIDADVLPLGILEKKFSSAVAAHNEQPFSPLDMLATSAKNFEKDGQLGAVMVISVELGPDEKKSVEQAVSDTSCPTFQPLGLFNVHKNTMSSMPPRFFKKEVWKACLKNALDGYAYSITRQPSPV
ncbi:hypothetical protein GGX14DRAFT_480263 [Mycena pura]|uniref:Uncharacterized protein n=1 Tax=Mycena pura TaxID=153505 RepID=A0AAD6UQ60_9AGAR|nr:hypothetical protein GGX14DRAFT_480263 [Mycena pura]